MNIEFDCLGGVGGPEGGEFVPGYLLYLLATASGYASNDFCERIRNRGVRVPEWRILAGLTDGDGRTMTHLAQFALIEQSRLTRIIDQMVIKGLVFRSNDKRDRRLVRIYLTAPGRGLAEELVEEARAHEAALSEQLPAGEALALKDALKRITMLGDPAARWRRAYAAAPGAGANS